MKKFSIFICIITFGIFGILFTETGRNFLLQQTVKHYLQNYITISVTGMDNAIRTIDKINIKTIDGIKVTVEKIRIDRARFFGIPYFHIGSFKLAANNIHNDSKMEFDKSKVLSVVEIIPLFTSGFLIKKFCAEINGQTHEFNEVKYKASEQSLFARSNEYGDFFVQLNMGFDGMSADIEISNFMDITGKVTIKHIISEEKKFQTNLKYKNYDVLAKGHFTDPKDLISIDESEITCLDNIIKISGYLYPQKRQIEINLPLAQQKSPKLFKALSVITNKNEDDIRNYIKDMHAKIYADLYGSFISKLVLKDANKSLLEGQMQYQNHTAKLDIYFINTILYGYKLKKLTAEIGEKNLSAKLYAKNLLINLDALYKNSFTITKLNCISEDGVIQLKTPIDFNLNKKDDTYINVHFDLKKTNILGESFPIKGSGIGDISYSGSLNDFKFQNIKLQCFFETFNYNDILCTALKINGCPRSCEILADKIEGLPVKLYKVSINKKEDSFNGTCLINNKHKTSLQGSISDDLKKIKMSKAQVKLEKHTIFMDGSNFDFLNNNYLINGTSAPHKKPGKIKIEATPNRYTLDFLNFSLSDISEIIDMQLHGRLNGKIELKNNEGVFLGSGKLSCSNMLTRHNEMNIDVKFQKTGLFLNADIIHRKHTIRVDMSLPFFLSNNFSFLCNNQKLKIRMFGKGKLENFFELPDKNDLQGDFDCDFTVSGNLKTPITSGYLKIKNMLISFGSVLLPNGTIEIIGDGSSLVVNQAKFVDIDKHIATASGKGRLFFDKLIPNLDIDLSLNFNKFFVLNSDTMKIQVTGPGRMYGTLNDMKLSGRLKVPLAEIGHFMGQNSLKNSKIEFLNDTLLQNEHKKDSSNNSFFTYDIFMQCNKIRAFGDVFEIFLKGNLELSMFGRESTLVGDLILYDGKLDLFGKRMKFTQGKVSFLREYPYDPRTTLLCQRNFGNMIVSFKVHNSPKKGATFKLFSNPSYSQDVILSQMLFNKDMKSLNASEAAQLVHAVTSIGNAGYLFSMLNTFKKAGLWDDISFSSGDAAYAGSLNEENNSSNQQQINISAGKYLQDNIYVSLNKKEGKTTFDIDLGITPTASVKANTAGEFGISWKYRY